MKFIEFLEKFSEAVDDHSVKNKLPDFLFKDMEGWDSFSAMSVLAMVDNEFKITISANDLNSVMTLGQLYDLIISKTNNA